MNPYAQFVQRWVELQKSGQGLPLGTEPAPSRPPLASHAPTCLIFSPHPDDEVIIGGLPLRLARESGWRVINVAVTQGSNKARRQERWEELSRCCEYIGFGLVSPQPGGLDGVNLTTRQERPADWRQAVSRIAELLTQHRPEAIFFPHDDDWNSSHIGTHHLVVDALQALPKPFSVLTVETEFWGAMDTPNLMVESSTEDLVALITALSFHVGEVRRNPYHLRMPAWMMDNVRRGGELVGGQGGAAPDFLFATLYRLRRWASGWQELRPRGTFVGQGESVATLFPLQIFTSAEGATQ